MYTPKELSKLYRRKIENYVLSRAEKSNLIPKAERISRGKSVVRVWKPEHLPAIGKRFGWLSPLPATPVISIFMLKAHVLKTTLAINLARAIALNGHRTIVIGLDVESSITDLLRTEGISSLKQLREESGLFALFQSSLENRELDLSAVIQKTSLPTLDYIPEGPTLSIFDKSNLSDESPFVRWFEPLLETLRANYDVIIFDHSSHKTRIGAYALCYSDLLVMPLSCDLAAVRHLATIKSFLEDYPSLADMERDFLVVPTLKEPTRISSEIEALYRTEFPTAVSLTSIRKTEQRPLLNERESIFEAAPDVPIAEDYYQVVNDIWSRLAAVTERPHRASNNEHQQDQTR